ncbi:hypothetical protein C8R45DRAFT_948334 [Mycena sanguinolenta]|nr:hypothetical protein C8R45DRAFT_948334 [Mycena sanguinolenta]
MYKPLWISEIALGPRGSTPTRVMGWQLFGKAACAGKAFSNSETEHSDNLSHFFPCQSSEASFVSRFNLLNLKAHIDTEGHARREHLLRTSTGKDGTLVQFDQVQAQQCNDEQQWTVLAASNHNVQASVDLGITFVSSNSDQSASTIVRVRVAMDCIINLKFNLPYSYNPLRIWEITFKHARTSTICNLQYTVPTALCNILNQTRRANCISKPLSSSEITFSLWMKGKDSEAFSHSLSSPTLIQNDKYANSVQFSRKDKRKHNNTATHRTPQYMYKSLLISEIPLNYGKPSRKKYSEPKFKVGCHQVDRSPSSVHSGTVIRLVVQLTFAPYHITKLSAGFQD